MAGILSGDDSTMAMKCCGGRNADCEKRNCNLVAARANKTVATQGEEEKNLGPTQDKGAVRMVN